MSSVNYENQILDAIDTLVDNAIDKAGYDKTIQAVIVSLEDVTMGRYKVKYQDSEIEAYSNNVDTVYTKGTLVNILVPGNDFSQTKTIIGIVGGNTGQTTVLEQGEQYIIEGGNTIAATQEFGLCSYHENEIKVLYNRDTGINDINFDPLAFSEGIKKCDRILCAAKFKTNFDNTQKKLGDFGVVYELDFKDNITEAIVSKEFMLDVDKMYGTPYDQYNFTRQSAFFSINGENFDSVKRIYIYCKDFPSIDLDKENDDIFIKDFELAAARELTEEERDGYFLTLSKKDKNYFNKDDLDDASIKIQAEVKFKMNPVAADDLAFYWFKENSDITTSSPLYLNIGGKGWENVNDYNPIDDTSRMILTNDDTYDITKAECSNIETRIKCVVTKENNDVIAENIISIYNYAPSHVLSIESNQGTQFYFDNGNPDLICKVDGEDNVKDFTYQWSTIDENNQVVVLEDTEEDNEIYNAAAAEYILLEAQVSTGIAMAAASQLRLDELKAILDSYEFVQRVENNKIFNVDITQINNKKTFNCMVKDTNSIIGSTDITLRNELSLDDSYTLNIINGTQVFNYDYNGVSPASDSLENPIKIKPLTFEVLDSQGKRFNDLIISTCEVQWTVPSEDTMLIASDSTSNVLYYSIADTYDSRKLNNNTIKLTLKYKDLVLNAETAFTFSKDGEPGTNGTGVVCKIVPNTNTEIKDYVMITDGTPNFTPAAANKWFKVQLWENGKKIYEGIEGNSTYNIKWSVLKNTYQRANNTDVSEAQTFNITENGICSYIGYNVDAASIVKVEVNYKDTTYYCTMPVIIAHRTDSNYTAKLVKDTGFRYVVYASDGKRPQYDNSIPFTIQVIEKINGYDEDISNIENSYKPTYQWNIKGKIFNPNTNAFVDDHHLTEVVDSNLAGNQKFYIPSEDFSGECVTNAIEVKILSNSTEKFKLLIPIHFYLDKYGISTLEGWDGNRISLDHDKGSILAPQVGAGKKNSAGQFTGVLMGEVKERAKNNIEQGLFGYHEGARTIFLDAETGKAEFGKSGKGQIVIDPSTNRARLYSGNYSTTNKSGMLIDLSEPEIRFGSGKFSVDKQGHITAYGGGTIAGWSLQSINNEQLLSSNSVIINGTKGTIYSNKTTLDATSNGFYIGKDGFSLGYDSNTRSAPFKVTNGGVLTSTSGAIAGWTINPSKLFKGNVGLSSDSSNNTNIALWAGSATSANAPFRVNYAGEMTASKATIEGTLIAKEGSKIGPWNITGTSIWYGNQNYGSANGLYFGASGLSLGSAFQVTSGGAVTASNATISGTLSAGAGSTIGPWTVTNSAIYNTKISLTDANHNGVYIGTDGISLGTGSTFKVTNAGVLNASNATVSGDITATTINASNGTIAGWTLGTNAFYTTSNALYLGNTGIPATIGGTSRSGIVFKAGDNFGVTSSGTVYAKNAVLSNATVGGTITATAGTIGGCSIDSNGDLKISSGHITSVSADTINAGTLSGAGIKVTNGTGYFKLLKSGSRHPWISGLNVNALNGLQFYTGNEIDDELGYNKGWIRMQGNYSTSGMLVHSENGLNIEGSNIHIEAKSSSGYLNLDPPGNLQINGTSGASKDFWTGDYDNIHFVIKKGIITKIELAGT